MYPRPPQDEGCQQSAVALKACLPEFAVPELAVAHAVWLASLAMGFAAARALESMGV